MPTALSVVQKFFPKVRKVNDADENAAIEVIAADGKSARRKDHNTCALAQACKRAFKPDGVIVSRSKLYMVRGTTATRYALPQSVSREIVTFDRFGEFDTGTYQLRAPSKQERLGSHESGNHDNHTSRKHSKFRHMTAGVRTVLGGQKAGE